MNDEDFEWDKAKAEANLKKHSISFLKARRVFDDAFALVEQDLSEDYGEDRFLATGTVEDELVTVAFTERGDRIRIINARRANTDE